MRSLYILIKLIALLQLNASSSASFIISQESRVNSDAAQVKTAVKIRALPNAPKGYAPEADNCPSVRPTIRSASKLSQNETSWLELRRNKTVDPMREFLGRMNISGFDAAKYISDNAKNSSALPNIAIAASGGGYRALMNGGGAIQAFDSREVNSTTTGHLGGLLQSSTYVAGLSGGGWLVGSIFLNNFTTVSSLLNNDNTSSLWEFENSIFKGPNTGGLQLLDTAEYFDNIYDAVSDKEDAGFQTSITDYWGRALSYQLINASEGGPGYTWSSIALADNFGSGDIPMPVLVADGRAPDETLVGGNATVFEFNPWEMGTWDPTNFAFAPLEYLGSNFSNGVLPNNIKCARGFDNAGYVMGTSSSLFNQFLLQLNDTDIPDVAKVFVSKILKHLSSANDDIADYSPNPFLGFHNTTSLNSDSQRLTLVDGGEDLQNIPLYPLIQPNRHVDVIFAIDSSADTNNFWPNGTSLVATYERSLTDLANGTSFPAVPGQDTFVNLGLNTHPTFFGCNSSNTTNVTPLVVYIPNFPYTFQSNFSTFTSSYNTSARNAIVQNGYESATMGNATSDAQWPTCVGCAILSRSLERTRTTVPDVCQQCFTKYCWDGTVNNTAPGPYEPGYKLKATNVKKSDAGERKITICLVGFMVVLTTLVLSS